MEYLFIEAGSVVTPHSGTIYLDVGNALAFGIIDHHQLVNVEKSATRLVSENRALIDENLHTIVLHKSPDLDCIAASFLLEYYLKNGQFPDFTEHLCDFLDKVDFGRRTKSVVSLASLFSIVKSSLSSDAEIVFAGHKLIASLAKSKDGFNAEQMPEQIYAKEQREILLDKKVFEKDLRYARKEKFTVREKITQKAVEVEGLILIKPKSHLFKAWARAEGYDLLIVQWSAKRVVISVKGDGFLSLEGIGDNLNDLEVKKREELNIIIDEPNREGYSMPDPWYDGRAHGYTIIDAPRRGTILTLEEILVSLKD